MPQAPWKNSGGATNSKRTQAQWYNEPVSSSYQADPARKSPAKFSERVIDAGENRGTLTAVADIYKAHYEWIRDATKANSAHRV